MRRLRDRTVPWPSAALQFTAFGDGIYVVFLCMDMSVHMVVASNIQNGSFVTATVVHRDFSNLRGFHIVLVATCCFTAWFACGLGVYKVHDAPGSGKPQNRDPSNVTSGHCHLHYCEISLSEPQPLKQSYLNHAYPVPILSGISGSPYLVYTGPCKDCRLLQLQQQETEIERTGFQNRCSWSMDA